MCFEMQERAREFIDEWLDKNHHVDVLNSDFIDGFVSKVGCAVTVMPWGANKCPYASKILSKLKSMGILKRETISLGANWQPGFPKWIYTYSKNT